MDIDAITALATWAAVGGTLVAVWRQNRAAKVLARRQLFLQLAAQYDSEYFQQKRAALARKLSNDRTNLDLDDTVLVFFETMAHMEREGMIDSDLVKTTFVVDICSYWP